jgi:putative ABC transport system substrate-binding protein
MVEAMASHFSRRHFIRATGGAMAWPWATRAQQAIPMIGFLGSTSPGPWATFIAAFRDGLKETGFVEGRNVEIQFRWAEGKYGHLPDLAADLVRRNVAVLSQRAALRPS